ncbi:MAG TPA: hypothetical protein VGS78_08170 [Candidatus Sulfotelmatobacter sp.]|nr:hypothetical protein [Candidatus Sulfotelmatobacter sp.]
MRKANPDTVLVTKLARAAFSQARKVRIACRKDLKQLSLNMNKTLRPGAFGQLPHEHYEHLWNSEAPTES